MTKQKKILLVSADVFCAMKANPALAEKTSDNDFWKDVGFIHVIEENSIDKVKQLFLDRGFEVTVWKIVEEFQ
jgi:selenophosphate synthetase-related protein